MVVTYLGLTDNRSVISKEDPDKTITIEFRR